MKTVWFFNTGGIRTFAIRTAQKRIKMNMFTHCLHPIKLLLWCIAIIKSRCSTALCCLMLRSERVCVINAIVINGPWITGNYISMLDFTIDLTLGVNRINDQAETPPFIDAIDGHKSVQGKYLQLIILWVRGVINQILTWDGSVPGFFVYASAFPDPYGTFTLMVIILNLESGFKLNTTCSKTRDQDYDCIRLEDRMCCGSIL